MHGEKKERWMELCEQAANEQDSDKLHRLVREITRLLDEKEENLKKLRLRKDTPNKAKTPGVP